jgi:protein-S-isoprenylcysteine O-methyltransferase Ste14
MIVPVTIALHAGCLYTGAGLTAVIAGIIIFFTALFTIKALETYEGDLVKRGIYSKIRHPMYLSFILWLLGYSIFEGAAVSFIISLVFITNILFWRHLEEKDLELRFAQYHEYAKGTWF